MISPREAAVPPFDAHSPEARAIADLFTRTLFVCGVILVVVTALVTYCLLRFRAKASSPEPPQVHGHKLLEIGWTLVPILIVAGLLGLTAHAMTVSDAAANRPPDLTVIGHQWWWEVRYPSGAITANEIHIPVGRDLLVEVQSADVIHDFWVPQLGRKIDATPGIPTHVWMQADEPGEYLGTCAEYCGTQHAWMRLLVLAQPEAEFAAWERHESDRALPPADEAAARGLADFRQMTCASCHAIGEATPPMGPVPTPRAAPDLTHVAGRETLAAGLLTNTPDNLALWLKDPQAIKPGSHMPSVHLTRHQIADLVAYFETLK
jgi:cytochrome c oxidase subunit II